jgi:putative ABC transport system ATP-binding protein
MIELQQISKVYGQNGAVVHALRDIDLKVETGEFVAIVGTSGSGKTTLLNILSCMDQPSSGRYLLEGVEIETLDDVKLSAIRNSRIGLVFQSFNLLTRSTAQENVELPLLYAEEEAHGSQRALDLLKQVGLGDRGHSFPTELSGGQQQRVAIARALIMDPHLILADEPTGALDTRSGLEVMAIFQKLNEEGRTVALVTHDRAIANHARRVITLQDGAIVSDEAVAAPRGAEQELAALPKEVQVQ